MNLLKKTLKEYYCRKRVISISILLLIFISVSIFFLFNQNIYNFSGALKLGSNEKQEIFSYLKGVQPLEDEFYQLVSNIPPYSNEENAIVIEESISIIDKLLKDLIDIKAPNQVLENKLFFIQEINAIRNVLVEKSFWISRQDELSYEKSKVYFEEYLTFSELRRKSLIKLFDNKNIQYIELGNRIKYKTK